MASLYERFERERVNSDLAKVDREFDRDFSRPTACGDLCTAVHDSRLERRASAFDDAEGTLHEGLGCMHKLIAEMTTAASAMSNGTGGRMDNEHEYLHRMFNVEDVAGKFVNKLEMKT